ncbi:hypothetical protein PO909_010268 [Leuciscus waleckii]
MHCDRSFAHPSFSSLPSSVCPWRKMRAWGKRRLEYIGACYSNDDRFQPRHLSKAGIAYTWISKVRTAS